MKLLISLVLVALALGGFFLIGSPIEKSDNVDSVAKKAVEGKQIDTAQQATEQVMGQVSQQALDSGCKNPNSQACTTTTFTVVMGNLTIAILFVVLAFAGVVALIKTIDSIINSF